MAIEKQRTFDVHRRLIHVELEDDLGVSHQVDLACHVETCPACGRAYPKNEQGQVDLDALVKEVCEELSLDAQRVIEIFERHGADMSAHKERRAARLGKCG